MARKVATETAPETETPPQAAPVPVKEMSLTEKYRRLIVEHPDWSLKQLEEELTARGVEIRKSTLATYKTDTGATIKIAKSLGLWKE
jgi:hypothetical protein